MAKDNVSEILMLELLMLMHNIKKYPKLEITI